MPYQLVPAQHNALPAIQGLASMLPFTPPRRRRPILAILDLLQKRYGSSGDDKEPEGTLAATTEEDEGNKPADITEEPNLNLTEEHLDSKQIRKVSQPSQMEFSLLESILKDHPDLNNGFSYAYKYKVPKLPKLEEVEHSVQQSLNRYPQVAEDSLELKSIKAPLNFKKAQAKLDSILKASAESGIPVHLNTPGAFGPLLLNRYLEKQPVEQKKVDENPEKMEETVVVEEGEERRGQSQKTTKLVLKPVAKAVAGAKGIAVASPIAKAVLRRGQKVTLEYEPDAVAIAGPGGRAHAHPEFTVDYIDSEESKQ